MSHWKDHLNSTLLGAYSLFDDTTEKWKEVDGVITRCCHEKHVLGGSGSTDCHVGHTSLGKPIKLNHTISKVLESITGYKNPAKWVNVPCTFYVDANVKFGKTTTEAIRIKRCANTPAPPPAAKPLLEIGTETYDKAKAAVEAGTFDLEKLKQYYTITPEVQISLNL
jgi:hypothetical protein